MDKVVFSISKTQGNKFLVEDSGADIAYVFNSYSGIIDACPDSDGFQFDNCKAVIAFPNDKKMVNIHRYSFEKKHKNDVDVGDQYYWSFPEEQRDRFRYVSIKDLLKNSSIHQFE